MIAGREPGLLDIENCKVWGGLGGGGIPRGREGRGWCQRALFGVVSSGEENLKKPGGKRWRI